MEMKCDMKGIYPSIESQNFKNDLCKMNKHIRNVVLWSKENFVNNKNIINKLKEFLKFNNQYRMLYLKLYCYTYLLVSLDAQNVEAMDMLDELDEKDNEFMKSYVLFSKWIRDIENLDEIIDSSQYLLDHKFYLKEAFSKSKYILSEKEEHIINKMQTTGARSWQRFYMKTVTATNIKIKVHDELKEFSFGQLKNMAYDTDSDLRKLSYVEGKKTCEDISQSIGACLNGISGEAINIYDMKGYDSVLDKVLIESRMDRKTLNTMIEVIEDNLYIFHKYYKAKAKALGNENNLAFYDIYAPIGKGDKTVSYKECQDLIISSFRSFSDELCNFAKKAFNEKWVDAEPSSMKGNFALSVDIFPIKESRIMINFSKRYVDVPILAHEIGHAYHSYCLKDEHLLNTDYPIPIAETASIFCETIVNNELVNNTKEDYKITVLERNISDALYYIVEMYGRFLFECELFRKRKTGMLSVIELNEIMQNSMEKVYGSIVDKSSINPYSWINNVGFYMPGNEFLNFPYIFGVLFSKGLYAEYLNDKGKFMCNYNKFLKNTSTHNIYYIAKFMNIDIHSRDFFEGAFKVIKGNIDEFCKYISNNQ